MATPADNLPPPLSEDLVRSLIESINLPPPIAIVSPKVAAAYHSIYIISFLPDALNDFFPPSSESRRFSPTDLILRVSGNHIPKIKTDNEAAIISWIGSKTTIPIPAVIKYDGSTDNPIGHEYILLERAYGCSLDQVYSTLDETQLVEILDQLIDVLVQLHAHEWQHIGGLKLTESGEVVPGPVLDETFWQVPDILQYWGPEESVETLNICGPFASYVEYISAHIKKYVYAIKLHDSLEFMRDILPRLDTFLGSLTKHAVELNKVKLRLAHKDLHFGNMLYDSASGKITAIIDWEFAGVVPFTRWDPVKAFLWNCSEGSPWQEKYRLYDVFVQRCRERGTTILQDMEFSSAKQESMQKVANLLRAIVEVSPRGQRKDVVGSWKDQLLDQISVFDA